MIRLINRSTGRARYDQILFEKLSLTIQVASVDIGLDKMILNKDSMLRSSITSSSEYDHKFQILLESQPGDGLTLSNCPSSIFL